MIKPNEIVISFDLDFTLIDNREGIVNSFLYALEKQGEPPVNAEWIESKIGTPLNDMFSSISQKDPSLLSATFREFYSQTGMYQVKLIEGARETLEELFHEGFSLGIVTSKKEEIARQVVKSLHLNSLFQYVLGETADRPLGKRDPNLKQILKSEFPAHHFIIVGDHLSDRALAELMGCPFIGVLTGHHNADQLQSNAKIKTLILDSVADLTPDALFTLF